MSSAICFNLDQSKKLSSSNELVITSRVKRSHHTRHFSFVWYIYRIRIWCCGISKISNEVERNDNFLAKARKLSFLSTELDIFDIRQHYVRIPFIFQRLIC